MFCDCHTHLQLNRFFLAALFFLATARGLAGRLIFGVIIMVCALNLEALDRPAGAQSLPSIAAIKLTEAASGPAGSVRLDIIADRRIPFLAYGLEEPHRLVVDFPELRFDHRAGSIERFRPFVKDVRFGRFSEGKSRLVIELDRHFSIAGQSADQPDDQTGYRIALTIRPNRPVERAKPAEQRRSTGLAAAIEFNLIPKRRPESEPVAPAEPERRIIVLDPGHGGIDPGAIAVTGVQEKNIVLTFAHELRKRLEAHDRYDIVMTRDDDTFIRLRQRLRVAREVGAHLFISIHADSIRRPDFRGASVYTLSSTASDEEAERLATQENKADILHDTDLSPYDPIVSDFLIDLVRRDTYNKSIEFAEILVDELGQVTRLVRRNRRFAGFAVLKSPETPSVLVELGFLSNKQDAIKLQDAERRAAMATAIDAAIARFFATSE